MYLTSFVLAGWVAYMPSLNVTQGLLALVLVMLMRGGSCAAHGFHVRACRARRQLYMLCAASWELCAFMAFLSWAASVTCAGLKTLYIIWWVGGWRTMIQLAANFRLALSSYYCFPLTTPISIGTKSTSHTLLDCCRRSFCRSSLLSAPPFVLLTWISAAACPSLGLATAR